jgi:signal transduction histidine kinase
MILLQGWIYYDRFRVAERQVLLSELELARSIGHDFENYISNLKRHQKLIGKAILALEPFSQRKITLLLGTDSEDFPSVRSFIWIQPNGKIAAFSGQPSLIDSLQKQSSLKTLMLELDFFISDLVLNKSDLTQSFFVSHSMKDTSGKFAGVVAAEIDPTLLGNQPLPLRRSNRGVFTLFDTKGHIAYRWPVGQITLQQSQEWLKNDDLLQRAIQTHSEQMGITHVLVENVDTWISARVPLKNGWILGTGRPQDIALAPIWQSLGRDVILLITLDLLIFLFTLLISQTISSPILTRTNVAHLVDLENLTLGDENFASTEVKELWSAIVLRSKTLRSRQNELEKAIRTRDEMMAVVSHDLRNPLGAIIMTANLIKRLTCQRNGSTTPIQILQHIDRLLSAGNRMNQLIQDLLDVTRLEISKLKLEFKSVTVSQLLRETFELFSPLTIEKSIHLKIPDQSWIDTTLDCDYARILQVFSNLIGNAIKFTPEGGVITVIAKTSSNRILFSISDTGRGISEEELPHIFDRFWQPRKETKRGLGLGLFICKGIIDGHGGHLWVQSRQKRGTTFYFELPKRQSKQNHLETA